MREGGGEGRDGKIVGEMLTVSGFPVETADEHFTVGSMLAGCTVKVHQLWIGWKVSGAKL